MSQTNRRGFLAAGAGAGAVAATGFTVAAEASTRRSEDSAQERVVAYVPDPSSDEVHLLVGEREVVRKDRDLVNRILNAAGGR